MSLLTAIKISRAPFFALGAVGTYWGTLAAAIPGIKAQAGASDLQLGLALVGGALGSMVAMWFAPRLSVALGRHVLPALAIVVVAAMQLPPHANSPGALFAILAVLGGTLASVDIGANMRLSQLEERHGVHLMNINHAMFSLCFGSAALVVGGLRHAGVDLITIFAVMGVVNGVLAALTYEGRAWRPFQPLDGDAAPTAIPWLIVSMAGLMLLVSFVGETAVETWTALFIERELDGAPGQGSFGPATLGFIMAAVRLLGQVTTEKLGEDRVIIWSGALGVIGILVIATAPGTWAVLIGVGIAAAGLAVIVPTANSLLGKMVHREQRAHAIARAWLFGMFGFFIGPSLIGFIAELAGLRVAFVVVAGLVSAIIPAVLVMTAHKRRG